MACPRKLRLRLSPGKIKKSHRFNCPKKRAYESEANAWVRISKFARKQGRDFGDITPYLCSWCERWHIGHKPAHPYADDCEPDPVTLEWIVENSWKLWQKATGTYMVEPGYDRSTGHYRQR